jgi:hypothetical protein
MWCVMIMSRWVPVLSILSCANTRRLWWTSCGIVNRCLSIHWNLSTSRLWDTWCRIVNSQVAVTLSAYLWQDRVFFKKIMSWCTGSILHNWPNQQCQILWSFQEINMTCCQPVLEKRNLKKNGKILSNILRCDISICLSWWRVSVMGNRWVISEFLQPFP